MRGFSVSFFDFLFQFNYMRKFSRINTMKVLPRLTDCLRKTLAKRSTYRPIIIFFISQFRLRLETGVCKYAWGLLCMYVCLAPHQWPEVARSKLEQVEVLLWVELFFLTILPHLHVWPKSLCVWVLRFNFFQLSLRDFSRSCQKVRESVV